MNVKLKSANKMQRDNTASQTSVKSTRQKCLWRAMQFEHEEQIGVRQRPQDLGSEQ